MSEWKEVWYPWEGVGTVPEKSTRLKLSNSWHIDSNDKMVKHVLKDEFCTTIVAYTTGQMRRRVECMCCCGTGFNEDVYNETGIESYCVVCNGKGYIWKYTDK